MEKCPICGQYGTAFPESEIETTCGNIHYQRCNVCNFAVIDCDELKAVLERLGSKIEDLESRIEDLEDECGSLNSKVAKQSCQLSSIDNDEIPDFEPSFDSPR